MLLERGGKLETKPVSHHRSLFQLVCLLLPISSGHRCSRGGKIHGSRSRSPARISRQPDQPGPSQHTPLQGDSQQQSAPERTKSSTQTETLSNLSEICCSWSRTSTVKNLFSDTWRQHFILKQQVLLLNVLAVVVQAEYELVIYVEYCVCDLTLLVR